MVQAGGQNCCQITTGTIALAFSHVSIHSRVYPIGKRISSDKQDISSDIFFFEFNLHDVCTSSVRTSGCMISNCIFLVVQVALLAQRLEVYAPHGVLNSLSTTRPLGNSGTKNNAKEICYIGKLGVRQADQFTGEESHG